MVYMGKGLQRKAYNRLDKLIQAGISDSQIYKAAGDGLSVPIAKEIGERIRKTYEENN